MMWMFDRVDADIKHINSSLKSIDCEVGHIVSSLGVITEQEEYEKKILEENDGVPVREHGHCGHGEVSKECASLHHPCLGDGDYQDEDR